MAVPIRHGECSIHQDFCIPMARQLYRDGHRIEEVGTEYREEMLRLAMADLPKIPSRRGRQ
jgi:hypothetical protein